VSTLGNKFWQWKPDWVKCRSSYPTFEEVRSFHSSQCICDLGHKEPVLCNYRSCGICSIVKSSFKSFAFGVTSNSGRCAWNCWLQWNTNWWFRSRFGEGIYSYRNPAFADQYATSCTSSPYRVMIACDALVEGAVDEVRPFVLLFVEQMTKTSHSVHWGRVTLRFIFRRNPASIRLHVY
jgi:hypothetical protein